MTNPVLLAAGAVISLVTMLSALLLLRLIMQQERRHARVLGMRSSAGHDEAPEPPLPRHSWLRGVSAIGLMLARSGLLPATTLAELEQTLVSAGLRRSNGLSLFIGAKLLLLLLLPLAAFAVLQQTSLSMPVRALGIGLAAVIGLLAPDTILRRMRAKHLQGVERGLPDALDMMVICSEAGLGLEPGLERVAAEIVAAHPAVAMELQLTSTELRILSDRRAALTNMGTRTELAVMKRLGGTLIQTMQYGTPLSQALRTLSSEMRYEMQMRFEAQAARLPVLLTVPMIVFILPCIFIVVGGPAGLTVARTLLHH